MTNSYNSLQRTAVFEELEPRLLLSAISPESMTEIMDLGELLALSIGSQRLEEAAINFRLTPSPDELDIKMSTNINAADTTNTDQLWSGGGLSLDLDGDGYIVGVWDAGLVLRSHDELYDGQTYRVTLQDSGSAADHATHVAGTIGASGEDSNAQGMAGAVEIWSYDWINDISEMDTAAASIVVSNHSYSDVRGWTTGLDWGIGPIDTWYADRYTYTEDPYFGKYDSNARDLDEVLYDNPDLLSVWAAGNERDDEFTNAEGNGYYVTFLSGDPDVYTYPTYSGPQYYVVYNSGATSAPDIDGNGGTAHEGYDSLSQQQTAKNTLVVGAIGDITSDPYDSGDVTMAGFSSWGNTDDGRLGIDVVANGVSVYSSLKTSDSAYASWSGTSMAAPNVTGTAVLLIEHYNNLFGDTPRSATTKGVILHTAFDAGNTGPDYSYGWGVVDAAAAANFLTDSDDTTPSDWVLENTYSGTEWTWELYSDGTDPLKATTVWTDPEGTAQASGLDVSTSVLVNDLDLWITGPGGTYYPWTLDRTDPDDPAVRTTANHLDNVEQVLIDSPTAGTYTVHIGRTGSSFTQNYSLLLSGASEQTTAPTGVNLKTISDTGKEDNDNITNLDNDDSGSKLDFEVSGTISGATVTLYHGANVIGTGTGNGGTLTITTNGTQDLPDGANNITARQTETGKLQSPDSEALTVTVDTTAPTVSQPNLIDGDDTGSLNYDNITQGFTPEFIGTASDADSGLWKVVVASNDSRNGTDSTTPATYSVELDTLDEAAGFGRTVTATAYDVAGNYTESSALGLTVDRTAPTVSGSPVINDGATQRDSIRSIEFTFDEEVTVTSGALQMYYYDGDSWETTSLSSPTFSQPAADKAKWLNASGLLTVDDTHLMARLLSSSNLTDIAGNQIAGNDIGVDLFRLHKLSGDINGDGIQSSADIDTLFSHFGNNSPYDLTGDGNTDNADVTKLVQDIFLTFFGDANLDGYVDGADLNFVLTNWGIGTTWEQGDFNDDDTVDGADLNFVLTNWTYPDDPENPNPDFVGLIDLGVLPEWT